MDWRCGKLEMHIFGALGGGLLLEQEAWLDQGSQGHDAAWCSGFVGGGSGVKLIQLVLGNV